MLQANVGRSDAGAHSGRRDMRNKARLSLRPLCFRSNKSYAARKETAGWQNG